MQSVKTLANAFETVKFLTYGHTNTNTDKLSSQEPRRVSNSLVR